MAFEARCASAEPLVSVIIPAYNSSMFISHAVNSVVNQSYTNWEIIIIDDCSTDDTADIINGFVKSDERIFSISNECNLGVSKSRNLGIERSTGDFIAFLDADDVWHKDKLKCQLDKLNNSDFDFSYTSYAIVDANGFEIKNPYIVPEKVNFEFLLRENFIGCSTVMFSRKIADSFKFPTNFYHEDYCLWLDIFKSGYRSVGCSDVLVDWRLISDSRSFNKKNSAVNRWKIYREYLKLSFFKSSSVFISYAIRGLKKYIN